MTAIGPHDLVDIPGLGRFEVVGYPEDYSHGPWPFPFSFPTPYTVGVHTFSSTTGGDYNREQATYTPGLGEEGTPVAVHCWSNPVNTEPKIAGHNRVIIDLELYMPPRLVVNLRRVEG